MFGRSLRMFDIFDPYGLDDMGFGGSRYALDGDVDRRSFAPVSGRALGAYDNVGSVVITAFSTRIFIMHRLRPFF
jgi:hypothetical protein